MRFNLKNRHFDFVPAGPEERVSSRGGAAPSAGELQQCRHNGCRGFTLIEILASAAIVLVLISVVMASVGQTKTTANRAICVNNLRTLTAAVLSHATDNGGSFPSPFGDGSAVSWDGMILPYLMDGGTTTKPLKLLQCPEDKRPVIIDKAKNIFPRSYKLSSQPAQEKDSPMGVVGYWDEDGKTVGMARRVVTLPKPADTIVLFENFTANTLTPGYIDNWQFRSGNSMGSGWLSAARITGYRADGSKKLYHGKSLNFAMADGHVESRDAGWPYTPVSRWDALR